MNDAQIRTKNGELRDLLLSLSKIEVEGVTCALVAGTDVTNLKHMEKELARLDRLNIVGEIAASIGHEVRNPLTTVRGYLQFLSKKEEFTSFSAQFNLMVEELDRANGIITDFLSLAKDKKLELEPLNLNDIIDNLLPLLNADALLAGHQVIFEKRAIPDLNLDGKEIRQFIFNLVRNSFEAMVPGGQVRIQTLSDAKSVILSVTDTGHGIPSAILDQLGTPFVTTKPNGTGLGLSVCYRIAQRHNAKIEVKSSSAGTSFIVKFRVH
jgi:two-component system, sporulation sensor kinase E